MNTMVTELLHFLQNRKQREVASCELNMSVD